MGNAQQRTLEDINASMTENDRMRAFKRMARNMAAMIDWPHDDALIRASGQCVCEKCGLVYSDHPQERGLNLTCDGKLVKL